MERIQGDHFQVINKQAFFFPNSEMILLTRKDYKKVKKSMPEEITTIAQALEVVKARYEQDEKLRKTLKDYKDPIELTFVTNNTKAWINVKGDQGIEVKQTGDDSAPVKINFESEQTMLDLLNKKLGAVAGYSSGKIKVVSGAIKNLLKLRKLLF